MGKEIELKYKLPEDVCADDVFENALVKPYLSGAIYEIAMNSTYFDTPDGALSKNRRTLRLRLENDVSVVTVKTPLDLRRALATRGEWQVNAESVRDAIAPLEKLGAPQDLLKLASGDLCVVAQFSFIRKCATVKCSDFCAELCVDIGFLSPDGIKKTPLHEVEIELISGDITSLCAFGKLLAARLSLTPEKLSKHARARNLR